jgi:hypothetical protein
LDWPLQRASRALVEQVTDAFLHEVASKQPRQVLRQYDFLDMRVLPDGPRGAAPQVQDRAVPAPSTGFVTVAAGEARSFGVKSESPLALEYSGLRADPRNRAVELSWFSSSRRDFQVYRADGQGAADSRISEAPVFGSGKLWTLLCVRRPRTGIGWVSWT